VTEDLVTPFENKFRWGWAKELLWNNSKCCFSGGCGFFFGFPPQRSPPYWHAELICFIMPGLVFSSRVCS